MPIEAPILLSGPITLIAPGLEIGLGPVRQEYSACCLEGGARLVEGLRGAVHTFPRMAARIEPASPTPRIFARGHAGAERDCAGSHVTIVDVPAFVGSIESAA